MAFRKLESICQDVMSRLNTDEVAGSELRASPEEREAAEPEAPTTVTGRPSVTREENAGAEQVLPGMQRDKPRTRSGDKWVVMPPKRTPGRTGAKSQGELAASTAEEPSPSREARPVLLICDNGKCLPARPKASSPQLGAGNHLRLVGGTDHHGSGSRVVMIQTALAASRPSK